MKTLVGTPAEVAAAVTQISAARGYPKRGHVYRRDAQGELQHVTGDRRYDVGTIATFAPEITTSDDGTVQAFDVDTGISKIPPDLLASLREEKDLPPKIREVRDRRKGPPIDAVLPGLQTRGR
jgi:hypothetical protein